jgi:hypothetical protein
METRIDLSDILIINSTYDRGHLKRRLYADGLKKRECEMCGQGEEWQGKKMSLILDHINGVNNDNRIENLRIVCPNCNATLDTHCGKKNKGVKLDKRFGPKTITVNRKVERPSLEDLLIQVKRYGYVKTGEKYGVSDNAVRKWIKRYEQGLS